jgi:hypothetical protein
MIEEECCVALRGGHTGMHLRPTEACRILRASSSRYRLTAKLQLFRDSPTA